MSLKFPLCTHFWETNIKSQVLFSKISGQVLMVGNCPTPRPVPILFKMTLEGGPALQHPSLAQPLPRLDFQFWGKIPGIWCLTHMKFGWSTLNRYKIQSRSQMAPGCQTSPILAGAPCPMIIRHPTWDSMIVCHNYSLEPCPAGCVWSVKLYNRGRVG